MPVLLSYAPADAHWAQWITGSLQAAGHAVTMHPAGVDFAHRMTVALSGSDRVLILVSAEHPASESDWARVATTAGWTVLALDAVPLPAALDAANCKSLHDLDEEEALEILLGAVGGPRDSFSRTPQSRPV
ncbi:MULTISPECIES: toll/interleukin-1 receptor domain-containing protein [unclassified Actinoplanes]|uniref:toll/interleukin-1 receptor domain-containing protein n=1 Tax=unclassified Actinoplanes TaxID=2626549 RepID=UPI0012F8EC4D|nr:MULTISPECIES: toll/interleukin-1 receptor domain-containing protein [unclassified Actinoplanes]